MRGHYYDDGKRPTVQADAWKLPTDDNRPQVIISPETPSSGADVRAIVQAVALRVLLGELDYSEQDLREHAPALNGISSAQIRAAIEEGLA